MDEFKEFWRLERPGESSGPYSDYTTLTAAGDANQETGEGCEDFSTHPGPCDSREHGTPLFELFYGKLMIGSPYRFGFATREQALEWWSGEAARKVFTEAGYFLAHYKVKTRVDGNYQCAAKIEPHEDATLIGRLQIDSLRYISLEA